GAAEGPVDDGVNVAERRDDHQHPLFAGDADRFDGDQTRGEGLSAEDVVVVDALHALVRLGGVLGGDAGDVGVFEGGDVATGEVGVGADHDGAVLVGEDGVGRVAVLVQLFD